MCETEGEKRREAEGEKMRQRERKKEKWPEQLLTIMIIVG